MVKVSIIMPTYNRGNIIKNAIDSVILQKYEEWELIIVDDGSADNTQEVVNRFDDERIIYIKNDKNNGANHARNVGLSHACGEYVCFLDSDNFWKDNFLGNRIEELSCLNEEYGIVFGRTHFPGAESEKGEKVLFPSGDAVLYSDGNIVNNVLVKGCIDLNTICIKRTCLEAVGGFDIDLKRLQDWDMIIRYLLITKGKIKFLDNTLVCNCVQQDSISKKDELYWDARIHILKISIEMCREYDLLRDVFFELFAIAENIPMSKKQKREFLSTFTYEELFEINMRYIIDNNSYLDGSMKYVKQLTDRKKWVFSDDLFVDGSKIILYGYGEVGKDFYWQIMNSERYELAGVIDKKFKTVDNEINIKVIDVATIREISYDYILVAIMKEETAMQVKEMLIKMGCDSSKIVWVDLY